MQVEPSCDEEEDLRIRQSSKQNLEGISSLDSLQLSDKSAIQYIQDFKVLLLQCGTFSNTRKISWSEK